MIVYALYVSTFIQNVFTQTFGIGSAARMGRKRLYHTEEDKLEAKRRNRMRWYDK